MHATNAATDAARHTRNAQWRAFFDRSAAVHDGSYRTSGHANRYSFNRQARLLSRAFTAGPATAMLDAGCGTDGVAEPFARTGTRVVGIDYSIGSVARAPRHGLRAVGGDLLRLPIRDECFARVASVGVIQHFDDPAPMLRELFRVTRPGGELVIATTNAECIAVRLHRLVQRVFRRRNDFSRLFTAGELLALTNETGWRAAEWVTASRRHPAATKPPLITRMAAPTLAVRLQREEGR